MTTPEKSMAEVHESDARREAWEELGRQHDRTIAEADREAEEQAARAPSDLVTERRVAFELEFAAEVATLAGEHGGPETTHDVARATANIATRWGSEYDRAEVADVLSHDPEPVGPDYLPLGTGR